ncbi:MAG: 4a-hydroxytetrahydrobiopterin dehydratase [Solirubrobacteraceae bacterium]|nr:4a-hydroxytetrahydrobiopterin dehydratase [Solirubrobacteraceae bacterium]
MALLHDEAIETLLEGSAWHKDGRAVVRDFEFGNFNDAVAFVNRVAIDAEKAGHHPDILIHDYREVQIRISTHTEGGITMRDIELASAISTLV